MNITNMIRGERWRAYHFGNYYLSSIQQGIQAAHAQTTLFRNAISTNNQAQLCVLMQWAARPTTICLNGGNAESLRALYEDLSDVDHSYPLAAFYEDEASLSGLMTNVAIILPAHVYGLYTTFGSDFRALRRRTYDNRPLTFPAFIHVLANEAGDVFNTSNASVARHVDEVMQMFNDYVTMHGITPTLADALIAALIHGYKLAS